MIKEAKTHDEYDASITYEVHPRLDYDYGSYTSGLPSLLDMTRISTENTDLLDASYATILEFSKWAIENKVCWACRFPWKKLHCDCEKSNLNKDLTDNAIVAANNILNCLAKFEKSWADKIEKDLKDGTSLNSKLNRKAAEIKRNIDEQKNYAVSSVYSPFYKAIWQKNFWVRWFRKLRNWCSIDYLRWKFRGVIKGKNVVSIPLDMADSKIIEDASFGVGNVCVKTKGGSVVVVPSSMVERMKKNYSGGSIVAPLLKE